MEERTGDHSPSMKHRLKHSLCGCFKTNSPHQHQQLHHHYLHEDENSHRTLVRSTSGGAGGMMRNLISRIGSPRPGGGGGGRGGGHHRKSKSTDFHYDPHSYALNFEEDGNNSRLDEYPLRNFSSRLPPSPPSHPHPHPHPHPPNKEIHICWP